MPALRACECWYLRAMLYSLPSFRKRAPVCLKLKLTPFFDAVVDGQDTEKGKPDPEALLLAARKMRTPTGECLVVENTCVGLEAARQAGMKALALGSAAGKSPVPRPPEGLKDIDLPALLRDGTITQYLV